jgi:class 3 adenylate cyclase
MGDLHDGSYDNLKQVYKINDVKQSSSFTFRETAIPLNKDHCPYNLTVYPSQTLEDEYVTYKPALYTFLIALAFLLISAVAITYDCVVQRRLKTVLDSALESRAIVSSLFPANVRDRLFEDDGNGKVQKKERTFGESADDKNSDKDRILASHPAKLRLKNFLDEGPAGDVPDANILQSKPIADLFPHCTVLFTDIAGFTAWSSEREPAQVFMLLQTLFHFFDNIARKWGVFKVETIGDCYVAVTGLPDPQADHAIRMTKFARECLHKVNDLTHKLESTLGPDTGDLKMRFGLHSGPVTAGVLRGEKSRFQLFGDTVNTASRMESTGKKDFIHISQSTADQLIEGGKESWITPREDLVSAKGKGEIQTYWVNSKTQRNASSSGTDPESGSGNDLSPLDHASKPSMSNTNDLDHHSTKNRKLKRLVDWQTDILTRLLKPVLAQRGNKSSKKIANPALVLTKGDCVLDEVAETLVLPKFDAVAAKANVNPNSIELSPAVIAQLRDFVTIMATRYLDNPFHNFEHASHVTMSASKLLNRIVIPEDMNYERKSEAVASDLHDYTYGITSDPLTQFTVIFCALIHDVDHRGVSNFQLANEIPEMATKYKNRGLAEQNSVDIAWDLLMQPQYKDLQKAIFSNEFELQRFRQLVVNLVMSTDIFDKDSKALRNSRWDKAFHRDPSALALSEEDTTNLKATIVIEHIIQAADVAHTMQHWHVYQKWNERLFQEMYVAFEQGRSATDPSAGWYKGELWFFDNYVIPLAKKLDECNVFGVASDEGLNYALANRAEWAIKGEDIVAEMLGRYTEQKNGVKLESGARSFV